MDYWQECISIALDESGISATEEQIENIAGCVEAAHENYGMAHGYDVIGSYSESSAERKLQELKQEQNEHDNWVNSTKPCKACTTTGLVRDGWGRDVTCMNCDGKGRHR